MLVEVPVQIRAAALGHSNVPFFYTHSRRRKSCGGIFMPRGDELLQSCKYCGRMHPLDYECQMKPQKRRKNTRAQRFRNTMAWKECRARVNERDLHLCRLCLLDGKLQYEGLSTHHIIPLELTMDYATDDDWCITLCDAHHKAADAGKYNRPELHKLAMEPPKLPT